MVWLCIAITLWLYEQCRHDGGDGGRKGRLKKGSKPLSGRPPTARFNRGRTETDLRLSITFHGRLRHKSKRQSAQH